MPHQTAFEVACFVLVPGILLGQTIDHTHYFRQELLGLRSIGQLSEFKNRSTGGFLIITVSHPGNSVLTDSF